VHLKTDTSRLSLTHNTQIQPLSRIKH